MNFWIHLSNAGLINDQIDNREGCLATHSAGISYPAAKVGEGIFAATSQGKLYFVLGGFGRSHVYSYTGNENTTSGMSNRVAPMDAFQMDQKMDDGSPSSGAVKVIVQYAKTGVYDGTLIDDTIDAANNCIYNAEYNVTYSGTYNDGNLCTLSIKAQ